ncbi:CPBP family intramembrane glutamic endopeptidase [Tepidibacillus marianensis]|uniref:CPBP family intramembrane glutamic endopeptidase n=1 Tax=Tepidibacillus marianensis TaxID=3131995 RepID=UPI0030D32B67
MKSPKKIKIGELDTPTLLLNLYLTQLITVVIAFLLYYIFYQLPPVRVFQYVVLSRIEIKSFLVGLCLSVIIVLFDILLTRFVPKAWIDDGGINEKIFGKIPIWHIGVISIVVGFSEELLFRGAIQGLIGVNLTSILFTLIHFRYLNRWVLTIEAFVISLALGYLSFYLGWFSNFVAHTLIDFLLGIILQQGYLENTG